MSELFRRKIGADKEENDDSNWAKSEADLIYATDAHSRSILPTLADPLEVRARPVNFNGALETRLPGTRRIGSLDWRAEAVGNIETESLNVILHCAPLSLSVRPDKSGSLRLGLLLAN